MIMEKSVAKENYQLFEKLEPQVLDSLVQTPRRNDGAAGHRWRAYLRNFEVLEKEIEFTEVCESVGFIRRVSVGMHYKTIHDVNDGFEGGPGHAENFRFLVMTQNPKSNSGSMDIPELVVQFFKSKLHVALTYTESKYRYRQHQETVQKYWLLYPDAQTATWTSHDTMILIALQKVMN